MHRLQERAADRRAELRAVKNAAYAWRQAVYFLSLCDTPAQAQVLARLRDQVQDSGEDFQSRFAPAVDGLAYIMAGGRFDTSGIERGPGLGRRFLGWSAGPHWILYPATLSHDTGRPASRAGSTTPHPPCRLCPDLVPCLAAGRVGGRGADGASAVPARDVKVHLLLHGGIRPRRGYEESSLLERERCAAAGRVERRIITVALGHRHSNSAARKLAKAEGPGSQLSQCRSGNGSAGHRDPSRRVVPDQAIQRSSEHGTRRWAEEHSRRTGAVKALPGIHSLLVWDCLRA